MRAACLFLAACSAKPVPIANAKVDGPHVEAVAVIDGALHWYTVSLAGVHETHVVPLPSPIEQLVWLGRDPYVELRDHRVAAVTPRGLEILALPPASTWTRAAPENKDATHLESPHTRLVVEDGGLWLGHNDWSEPDGLLSMDYWVDVRIRPGPVVTKQSTTSSPDFAVDIATPSPRVEPSSTIKVALVPDLVRPPIEEGTQRMKLTCSSGGTTIEDPPVGEPPGEPAMDRPTYPPGRGDLIWLSTEPPIFELGTDDCWACPMMVIFEGCARSKRFDAVAVGPSDVMAFTSPVDETTHQGRMTFLWRGHELGTLDHIERFAFVPTR